MAEDRHIRIVIPEGVDFGALRLRRTSTGAVQFDLATLRAVCAASGIDIAVLLETVEDNVATVIVGWYAEHLRRGGTPDPVAEQLVVEIRAEDGYGNLQ